MRLNDHILIKIRIKIFLGKICGLGFEGRDVVILHYC